MGRQKAPVVLPLPVSAA